MKLMSATIEARQFRLDAPKVDGYEACSRTTGSGFIKLGATRLICALRRMAPFEALTLLPLAAAALAVGLMLIFPAPAANQWADGDRRQGRNYEPGDSPALQAAPFGPSGQVSAPKNIFGSRRDAVTGIWRPYR